MTLVLNRNKSISRVYDTYCSLAYRSVVKEVEELYNTPQMKKRYKALEKFILDSGVITWVRKPLHLDLYKYLVNCLELVKEHGTYVIRLNEKKYIPNSLTKVSVLIRLLEYGNDILRPTPLIRIALEDCKKRYKEGPPSISYKAFLTDT